jgi:histone H3/H4
MPSDSVDLQSSAENDAILKALHFAVGNICREEEDSEKEHSSGDTDLITMNRGAIETLTQLTFHYATKSLSTDLIAFRNHAGRKTISVEDVKLVARKNPRGLMDSLEGFCEQQESTISRKEKKMQHYPARNNLHNNSKKTKSSTNWASGKASSSIRMYSDSSSDDENDDLKPMPNLGKRHHRENSISPTKNSSSDNDLGIDIQVGDSSSSSSSSSGSDSDQSMTLNLNLPRGQNKLASLDKIGLLDRGNSSSDESSILAAKLPHKKAVGKRKSQSAIELSDSSDSE